MKFQRRQNNRSRRGFTLMELMLVMAILVVMASMVGFAFLNMNQGAQEDITRQQISVLKQACKQYKLHCGRFPSELNDLINQPAQIAAGKWKGPYLDLDTLTAGEVRDTWGQAYTFNADEQAQRVFIVSAGQDGQANTADDIPSPDEARQNQ